MIILCTMQTILSLFLFHKLYSKPNCKKLRNRIIDTSLVVLSLLPVSLIFVTQIPFYIAIGIMLLTSGIIWFLKQYEYNIEDIIQMW